MQMSMHMSMHMSIHVHLHVLIFMSIGMYIRDVYTGMCRTEFDYENALIVKIFMFEFTNNFISLFYIAFLRRYVDDVYEGEDVYRSCHDCDGWAMMAGP